MGVGFKRIFIGFALFIEAKRIIGVGAAMGEGEFVSRIILREADILDIGDVTTIASIFRYIGAARGFVAAPFSF